MGFMDRFTGGTTTLSLAVQSPDPRPGGTIVLGYEVGGELEKCHALTAGVTCVGRYIAGERGRDANGHPITREVWHEVPLYEQQQDLPVALGSGQLPFTLPTDAVAASGEDVVWTGWGRISRESGKESVERVPLAGPVAASVPTVLPDATQDGLTLHGLVSPVRTGESASGTLSVDVAEDLKVSGISVRLHRRCTYVAEAVPGYDGSSLLSDLAAANGRPCFVYDHQRVAEAEVSGKRSFASGRAEQLSFTVPVPQDAGPSTAYPHAQVEWRLEAVLERHLHSDLAVTIPIVVA
jgi:hypothetical protein